MPRERRFLRWPAVITWLLMVTSPSSSAESVTLDFNSTESPPIWSEFLAKGGLGGEILQAVAQAANLAVKIRYLPLKRYEQLVGGSRLGNPLYFVGQEFGAVIPLLMTQAVFCYYLPHRPQGIAYQSLADLKGLTLGVIRGTLEDKEAFRRFGVSVEENTSLEALFRKLRAGRVDVTLAIDIMAYDAVERLYPEESGSFRYVEVPGGITPIAIMLDTSVPDYAQLAARLRQALDDVIGSGVYHAILKKYYGEARIPRDELMQLRRWLIQYDESPVTVHEY